MSTQWRHRVMAPRFTPLLGVFVGAVGGGVYWLAAQLWPTSIAVVLSMLAAALLSAAAADTRAPSLGTLGFVFALLVKYNALMALSAANLPYRLPANLALGLIMIAGEACSRALVVSALASPARAASKSASHGDLAMALVIGFTPAALIGLPGLVGLAAAIVARIAGVAYLRARRPALAAAEFDATQQLTEVCFYLGALATWAYI
jgi:adenosylcobinamide-GDP ribazoletransferase